MHFTIAASAAVLLSVASVINAQDATCSAVLNDYSPVGTGAYQKCYTSQVYNNGLVAAAPPVDYKALIEQTCSKSACSASTLASAETKYLTACNASLALESEKGNILQLGKTALDVFFAAPIREAYCARDPNDVPAPTTPPTLAKYCLSDKPTTSTGDAGRFVSQLAVYLTSGTIRSTQVPFFNSSNTPTAELCSPCSQVAMTATVTYLSTTLMPAITPFYTPEFVQYWTNLVPAYNAACKTKLVQTWPAGTLNVTVPGVPPPTITAPTTGVSTPSGTSAPITPTRPSAAGSLKPAAGIATAVLMVVAALF